MTKPDQVAPPLAPTDGPRRVFLVSDVTRDAEIARQAGPDGLQPDDMVITLVAAPFPAVWSVEDDLAAPTDSAETATEATT